MTQQQVKKVTRIFALQSWETSTPENRERLISEICGIDNLLMPQMLSREIDYQFDRRERALRLKRNIIEGGLIIYSSVLDKIIGYCEISILSKLVISINAVLILPEYQKQGIMKDMLRKLLLHIKTYSPLLITFQTYKYNFSMINFSKNIGARCFDKNKSDIYLDYEMSFKDFFNFVMK